jgi:hypothetical protein
MPGHTVDYAGGRRLRGLSLAAAAALAAAVIWWAAFPVSGGGSGTQLTLVIAIATGTMSVAQLALAGTVIRQPDRFTAADRIALQLANLTRMLPWAELMTVAVLMLEVLHKSRPWHTAVLAVALTSYLLAVHLAETDTSAGALRAQLPLLSAGVGLTALSIGAAALPGLPVGPVATLMRIGAVVLAAVAAGLAVPVWLGRGRGRGRGR